jgi:hypothetical protein
MKPVSIYTPVSIERAIQILSLHGTDAGVYAEGTMVPRFRYNAEKIDMAKGLLASGIERLSA